MNRIINQQKQGKKNIKQGNMININYIMTEFHRYRSPQHGYQVRDSWCLSSIRKVQGKTHRMLHRNGKIGLDIILLKAKMKNLNYNIIYKSRWRTYTNHEIKKKKKKSIHSKHKTQIFRPKTNPFSYHLIFQHKRSRYPQLPKSLIPSIRTSQLNI